MSFGFNTFRLLAACGWLAAQPPAGNSVLLEGSVLDGASRKPIAGVRVRIQPAEGKSTAPRGTETDGDGKFAFPDLVPGQYEVLALKAGYRFLESNARRLKLEPGRVPAPVELLLHAGGVISGRVLNEAKEGVRDVPVGAWARTYRNGGLSFRLAGTGKTGAQGDYQIIGLPPGEYIAGTREPRREVVAATPAVAPDQDQPAFHPNSDLLTHGAPVPLGPAEQKDGIDILVRRGPGFCLSGAIAPEGAGKTVSVSVFRRWDHTERAIEDVVAHGYVKPGVPFFVCGLGRGRYQIQAVEPSEPVESERFTRAEIWITKSAADLGKLWLRGVVPIGVEIAGGKDDPAPERGFVVLEPADRLRRMAESLDFQLGAPARQLRAFPDRFRLTVGGMAPDTYLASADYDSIPVRDQIFAASGGVLRLRFARDAARVSGVVKGANGRPGGTGFVLLAPDPVPAAWSGMRTAPVREGGVFAIGSIPPGKYRAIAVGGGAKPELIDPESLRHALALAGRLDLSPKSMLAIELIETKLR